MAQAQQQHSKDLDSINERINSRYKELYDIVTNKEQSDYTIIEQIQLLGEDIEVRMRLMNLGDYEISFTTDYIIKGFKTRGFPERYIHYVYDAFYPAKYRKYLVRIDHSSVQIVTDLIKRREQSSTRRSRIRELLKEAADLADPDYLEREDAQDTFDDALQFKEKFGKKCEDKGIAVCEISQHDLQTIKDKFNDPIHISKPIPIPPTSLMEEINIWIKDFLPDYLKKHETYPDPKDPKGLEAAAGWRALRFMFEPVLDDKYRKMFSAWFTLVDRTKLWFKHQAATASRREDFTGKFRDLTREQIGAREATMKVIAKYIIDHIPVLIREAIWYQEAKEPYLAEFSNRLGPKLSDRSIR